MKRYIITAVIALCLITAFYLIHIRNQQDWSVSIPVRAREAFLDEVLKVEKEWHTSANQSVVVSYQINDVVSAERAFYEILKKFDLNFSRWDTDKYKIRWASAKEHNGYFYKTNENGPMSLVLIIAKKNGNRVYYKGIGP